MVVRSRYYPVNGDGILTLVKMIYFGYKRQVWVIQTLTQVQFTVGLIATMVLTTMMMVLASIIYILGLQKCF